MSEDGRTEIILTNMKHKTTERSYTHTEEERSSSLQTPEAIEQLKFSGKIQTTKVTKTADKQKN